MPLHFRVEQNDIYSKARAGDIFTKHGKVSTPFFMLLVQWVQLKLFHSNN
jgi:queuine/archaeosine tRNA-ribosyltransferase